MRFQVGRCLAPIVSAAASLNASLNASSNVASFMLSLLSQQYLPSCAEEMGTNNMCHLHANTVARRQPFVLFPNSAH